MSYLLTFHLHCSSLFSIRVPYTWQSALSYPLPPPSTALGLLANAHQRYENLEPPATMDQVEKEIGGVWARPLTPIVLKSHIVSTITAFGNIDEKGKPKKPTDALPRQFGFTHQVEIACISENLNLLQKLQQALISSPVYLGDSESLALVCEKPEILEVNPVPERQVRTSFYLPLQSLSSNGGKGTVFWVHQKVLEDKSLVEYIFPLEYKPDEGVYQPTTIVGTAHDDAVVTPYKGEHLVILPSALSPLPESGEGEKKTRNKRKKKSSV